MKFDQEGNVTSFGKCEEINLINVYMLLALRLMILLSLALWQSIGIFSSFFFF